MPSPRALGHLHRRRTPWISLLLLVALALPVYSDSRGGEPPTAAPGADPGASPAIAEDELAARREALKSRIFEPLVLEATSFRLFFERTSGSFALEDRRTGIAWHTSLDRKGFA